MMSVHRIAAALALSAVACCSAALACGICIDDKVAATYDYAVIQRAEAHGNTVVFCEIHGAVDARKLEAGARRIAGVLPASVRVSAQPAGISFAIDRKRQTPDRAIAALEGRVPGVRVTLLKVIGAVDGT
jgi:hypothetical protein